MFVLGATCTAVAPGRFVRRALVPGGSVVLAGLLTSQAGDVAAAYRRQGLRVAGREQRGEWTILRLRRPGFRVRSAG